MHTAGVGVGVAPRASVWGCSWGVNIKDMHAPYGNLWEGKCRNSAGTGVTHRHVYGYIRVQGRCAEVETVCEILWVNLAPAGSGRGLTWRVAPGANVISIRAGDTRMRTTAGQGLSFTVAH